MRLGVVVNVMGGDEAGATSYRIAAEATNRGHEVWVISSGGFSYEPDDRVGGLARSVPDVQPDIEAVRFVILLDRGSSHLD